MNQPLFPATSVLSRFEHNKATWQWNILGYVTLCSWSWPMNYEELVIREVSWEAEPGHQLTLPRHWRMTRICLVAMARVSLEFCEKGEVIEESHVQKRSHVPKRQTQWCHEPARKTLTLAPSLAFLLAQYFLSFPPGPVTLFPLPPHYLTAINTFNTFLFLWLLPHFNGSI